MKLLAAFLVLLLAGCGAHAFADDATPAVFFAGAPPTVAQAAPGPILPLCFKAYCLAESGAWREPVWSAEHLLAANLPAKGTVRKNPFHAEPGLPPADRAELADFAACSKTHDRGHATPVGDFTDPDERDATFSLANMMAQTKIDNEQVWNHIENGVRRAVKAEGEGYAVTGPHVPAGAPTICGQVAEPDAIWKAIYLPKSLTIGVYWSPNDTSNSFTTITVADLIARTGVDPFPALPADAKARSMALPVPAAGGN